MADLELFQLATSHFNEKARWALDYKNVPHVRHSLLPGLHKMQMRRLSGQVKTPVLRRDLQVVPGSAAIIDYLETHYPEPPLYPADARERAEALELQQWFDEELGPAIRRAKFADLMQDPGYFIRLFTDGRGVVTRTLYKSMFGTIMGIMRKDLEITEGAVARGLDTTRRAFDLVAERAGTDGYLVGDRFTVADLAAAALLNGAVGPTGGPEFPKPYPPVMTQWFARWADHPGVTWVHTMYERHRGAHRAALFV